MKRRTRRLFGAYLLALAASSVVRLLPAERPHAEGPEERLVRLALVAPGAGQASPERAPAGEVELFLRDLGPESADGATASEGGGRLPLVLLHGSPGSGGDLLALARALARERRVLVPDLPGFGRSRQPLPDYSIRAHACYVRELLDALAIPRAHVVGFSMGGGVALELADQAPERVASLTMLGAIGVVELELFGDQELNHLAHGAQLALVRAAQVALPHFGVLDRWFFDAGYARNFFDTDQAPLRGILERYAGPMLILHGEDDSLVPAQAAREHHRIVPQSELELLPGGHFLPFQEPQALADAMAPFLEAVDAGAGRTRAQAEPARVARAQEPFDPRSVPPLSGLMLFLFGVVVILVSFISEDLACVGVGALIARGSVSFLSGTIVCLIGITLGDVLLFVAGRTLGRRAVGKAPWKWMLSEDRVARSSHWFEKRGPLVIVISRVLPGTRLPTYFAAGVLRTSFPRFLLWFLLAAAVWTPIIVWLSARLGRQLLERMELFQRSLALGLLATVVVGFLCLRVALPLANRRGRRLAAARLRRLRRWEYWPLWVFYAPIVARVAWWTLRHRGRPLFTAANPALPHGGIVGESKSAILRALADAGDAVPATELLPAALGPDERRQRVEAFLARNGLALPVVIKPDVGERGRGVHVCRDREALERALDEGAGDDLLVQEYVGGLEYGVFYARRPGERRGRVLSITEKVLPEVLGDGRRTLEELVLDDERASLSAALHLANLAERLDEVPVPGERVRLGELGTHCRGATFRDGARLASEALEAEVDRISRSFPGFCFGRYDLRAASPEDLRQGRFRILELNGVTAEMGHVYDPRASLRAAWRTIGGQWRLAFEIGAANAALGARVSSLVELARLLLAGRAARGPASGYGLPGGADGPRARGVGGASSATRTGGAAAPVGGGAPGPGQAALQRPQGPGFDSPHRDRGPRMD